MQTEKERADVLNHRIPYHMAENMEMGTRDHCVYWEMQLLTITHDFTVNI